MHFRYRCKIQFNVKYFRFNNVILEKDLREKIINVFFNMFNVIMILQFTFNINKSNIKVIIIQYVFTKLVIVIENLHCKVMLTNV